jgi:NAD(P)H dehydrogenase (quinone)
MTIGITGATGQLGRLIVERLKARAPSSDIRALVRSVAKAADLGVEAREADYGKPDTLVAALQGVDTLLLISSSEIGQRAVQHQNVIDAAKKAGVSWIIYTSLLRADVSPIDLAVEHRATEASLKASGIPATILRNGWYVENHAGSIGSGLGSGAVYGSAGAGRFSSATRADFADAAVAVLTGTGHQGKTYELAGDMAYTLADLAAEIGKQSGKPVTYVNLPAADYAKALTGFGIPDGFAAMIAGWDLEAEKSALFHDGKDLSRLIGRPTTPVSAVIAAMMRG